MKFVILVIAFLVSSRFDSAVWADDSGPLALSQGSESMAKDGVGTIWGAVAPLGLKLKRWQNGGWESGAYSPDPKARIRALWTRADGRVVAFWNIGGNTFRESPHLLGSSDDYVLTSHYGNESKVLGSFQLQSDEGDDQAHLSLQIFPTDSGPFLLSTQGRDFYQVSDDGTLTKIYSVPASMIEEPHSLPGSESLGARSLNHFDSTTDQMGRTWIWQDGQQDSSKTRRFKGLLRYENGTITASPSFSGLPITQSTPIQAGWGRNVTDFYIALRGTGLFQIDLRTLKAKPVQSPRPGAFDFITEIWANREELDVVTGQKEAQETDPTLGYHSLWRRQNGQWSRVVDGLDTLPSSRHTFLKTSEGLWVTSGGRGAWFIGRDNRARQVDWQRGVNLPRTNSLIATEGNAVVLTGSSGTVQLSGFSALSEKQTPAKVSWLSFYLPPIQDAQLRIWAVLNQRDHALHEWDGAQWRKHPLPGGYPLRSTEELALDEKGRVWIAAGGEEGPTAIFDPKTGRWQVFASYPDAVITNRDVALPVPDRIINAHGWRLPLFAPQRGPRGQLAFVTGGKRIYLLDDAKLQSWSKDDLNPQFYFVSLTNPPFFGSLGQLCMEFNAHDYELTTRGWKETTTEIDPYHQAKYANPTNPTQQIDVPQRLTTDGKLDPTAMASQWEGGGFTDLEGTSWLFKEGNFYRAGRYPDPRIAVPMLNSHENQPFLPDTSVFMVMTDRVGNTFIRVSGWDNNCVLLKTGQPVPETAAKVEIPSPDSATAHFSVTGHQNGKARFTWRFDGGLWCEPTTTNAQHWEGLRPGDHFIEVKAIGANGRPDPTPVRVKWAVAFASDKSLRALIQQLSDPDFSKREAVIASLVRQRERSLPLLRQALVAAKQAHDEDKVWWLSAAIGEAERARS